MLFPTFCAVGGTLLYSFFFVDLRIFFAHFSIFSRNMTGKKLLFLSEFLWWKLPSKRRLEIKVGLVFSCKLSQPMQPNIFFNAFWLSCKNYIFNVTTKNNLVSYFCIFCYFYSPKLPTFSVQHANIYLAHKIWHVWSSKGAWNVGPWSQWCTEHYT